MPGGKHFCLPLFYPSLFMEKEDPPRRMDEVKKRVGEIALLLIAGLITGRIACLVLSHSCHLPDGPPETSVPGSVRT